MGSWIMPRVLQVLLTHCKSYSKDFAGKVCETVTGARNEPRILVTAVGTG